MVEQAADWLDSLLPPPEGQTANLEYFVQNFRQRYQTPETLMMKTVQELYSRQQQQEESVDDYCTQMLKLAKIVQVKDDLLLYTLLNGLRTEIATYVTQRGPKTVNELLTAARTAELTITPSKDLSLHAKVDKLMDTWQKMTVSPVSDDTKTADTRPVAIVTAGD